MNPNFHDPPFVLNLASPSKSKFFDLSSNISYIPHIKLFIQCCSEVNICGFQWNVLIIGCIEMKCAANIPVHLRMNFGDPLTIHLAPLSGEMCNLFNTLVIILARWHAKLRW